MELNLLLWLMYGDNSSITFSYVGSTIHLTIPNRHIFPSLLKELLLLSIQKRDDEVISYFERVSEDFKAEIFCNFDKGFLYLIIGTAYDNLKRIKEASICYEKTLEFLEKNLSECGFVIDRLVGCCLITDQYQKALSYLYKYPENFYYYDLFVGICLFHLEDYSFSIYHIKKSIALNKVCYFCYRVLGFCYSGIEDYQKAIICFEKLKITPINSGLIVSNRYELYYFLGHSYHHLKKYTESLQNLNKYVYLSHLEDCIVIEKMQISTIFFLNNQPLNSLGILYNLRESIYSNTAFINFISKIKWSKHFSIDSFRKSYSLIEDFLLIIKHYVDKKEIINNDSLMAVLYFYLGGIVESYRIYDEELDKVKGSLSARDCYYYARCTNYIDVEREVVMTNCIEECPMKTSEDLYYKGLLFLLQNNKREALKFFQDSKEFKFSNYLLKYFRKEEKKIEFFVEKELSIDINSFKIQIDEFIHLKECDYVTFESNIELMPNEFWEYFCVDREKWQIAQNKLEAEILVNRLVKSLGKYFEKKMAENILNTNKSTEHIIADNIRGKYLEKENFLDLLFYHYNNKKLTIEECFSLFCYFTLHIGEKKEKRIQKLIDKGFSSVGGEIFDIMFGVPVSTGIDVAVCFLEFCTKKDFRELFLIHNTNSYDDFKNDLWKYIFHEKETMSSNHFENKYFFLKT